MDLCYLCHFRVWYCVWKELLKQNKVKQDPRDKIINDM